MIDAYRTVRRTATSRLTRKRSRFIGRIVPVGDVAAARREIAALEREYHDATHHCSAYRVLQGAETIARAEDAGEPAGSAGRPMLQQLESADLVNVLAVVVRYFGGVKLGVGGLIRAYADTIAAALAEAGSVEKAVRNRLLVLFPPETNSGVMKLIHRLRADVERIDFGTTVRVCLSLGPSEVSGFVAALSEVTGGRASWEEVP